jgi:superfamily II DNA or RNA helicase
MKQLRIAGSPFPWTQFREVDDFGLRSYDLVRPPQRFWSDGAPRPEPLVRQAVDAARVEALPHPLMLLAEPPSNLMGLSRRTLAQVHAWFLVAEDPQRRFESREVASLCHQASLVQHVLARPELRRVMVADEVGLGKTIEAGLILEALLDESPALRVLYLAPARLVSNVRRELDRLGLRFRSWVSDDRRDATLADERVVASIHRAAHPAHFANFSRERWDVIVVDECHHLSDWAPGGGKATRKFRLVDELQERLPEAGRLLLMSGTPHQGHRDRFANLVNLLRTPQEDEDALAGRVIYRTKEDVHDWDERPLFPKRQVNPPTVLELSPAHASWLHHIHALFQPEVEDYDLPGRRAAGWRAGQALQWATSSLQAGLGYLVRQALRAEWTMASHPVLADALEGLRPYRGGPADEPVAQLLERMQKEIRRQRADGDVDDIEEGGDEPWRPEEGALEAVLREAIALLETEADAKWKLIDDRLLQAAGDEKVVLFAQPVETVGALAGYLERKSGKRPAMIIGNQSEEERQREIEAFWKPDGPQFLISSRAGGEGLNLQVARRLVHVDVPWNPMELEQRVGRVHRFGSRRTILVDTVVVKNSREEDMYAVARNKLAEVASTMVSADKLEMLFSRVMALVPPSDLTQMLGGRALGPLNDDERDHVSRLVTAGFARWQEFSDSFAEAQQSIANLDAGAASWRDVVDFAERYVQAEQSEGFEALRFMFEGDEVSEASVAATVLKIGEDYFSSGDHGGMPVTAPDGRRAQTLGLNVPQVGKVLREAAFPTEPTGVAHLRWEGTPPPGFDGPEPQMVLVVARQSLRSADGPWREAGLTLQSVVLTSGAEPRTLVGDAQAELLRALWQGRVRSKAWEAPELVAGAAEATRAALRAASVPSEEDRRTGTRHAVFLLAAVVVGG